MQLVPSAVGFKVSKLNPITNLGNLFSLRGATRVVKSLVPAAAMVVFGWVAVKALMVPMPVMSPWCGCRRRSRQRMRWRWMRRG